MLPSKSNKNAMALERVMQIEPKNTHVKAKINMGWVAPMVVATTETSYFSMAVNIKYSPATYEIASRIIHKKVCASGRPNPTNGINKTTAMLKKQI